MLIMSISILVYSVGSSVLSITCTGKAAQAAGRDLFSGVGHDQSRLACGAFKLDRTMLSGQRKFPASGSHPARGQLALGGEGVKHQ